MRSRRRPHLALIMTPPDDLRVIAAAEFDRAMRRNLKGLDYFRTSGQMLGASTKDVLIDQGTMRLYHYRALVDDVYRVPVLIVMSTTNRGYIFDMIPGHSLVDHLLHAGFDVFMLDWDAPTAHEKHLSLAHYVTDFLPHAVARIAEDTGEPDVSLIGYYLGGVLALLWAALAPAPPANLVTIATPIDFSRLDMFQNWADPGFFDVDRLVDTLGNCPADYLYAAVDMIRPATRSPGGVDAPAPFRPHRMVDRWATDVLPLAGEYFRETIRQLVWENRLMTGAMTVADRPVDLSRITAPLLQVTATQDHIVPAAASAPLVELVGSTDTDAIEVTGGHASVLTGSTAADDLWPTLARWLGKRST
jgi:polyhydroxyalkanoate synthase